MKLLACLGASDYKVANYNYRDFPSVQSAFSIVASTSILKPSKIVVFVTKEAEDKHRETLTRELEALKTHDFQPEVEFVGIPKGENERELWKIFETIEKSIGNEKEVALDITHGFRSLPVILILAAIYLRTFANITIKNIFYGAFEAGTVDTKPIFDLTPMTLLLDLTFAVDCFKRYGDSRVLATILDDLFKGYETRLIEKGLYQDIGKYRPIKNLSESLKQITNSLYLNRTIEALKVITDLDLRVKELKTLLQNINAPSPFSEILEDLNSSFNELILNEDELKHPEEALEKQMALSIWYYNSQHYVQAITLMRELLLTKIMLLLGKTQVLKREERSKFADLLNRVYKDLIEARKKEQTFNPPQELRDIADIEKILDFWNKIIDVRNDVDHAGMNPQPKKANYIRKQIEELISEFNSIIHLVS